MKRTWNSCWKHMVSRGIVHECHRSGLTAESLMQVLQNLKVLQISCSPCQIAILMQAIFYCLDLCLDLVHPWWLNWWVTCLTDTLLILFSFTFDALNWVIPKACLLMSIMSWRKLLKKFNNNVLNGPNIEALHCLADLVNAVNCPVTGKFADDNVVKD